MKRYLKNWRPRLRIDAPGDALCYALCCALCLALAGALWIARQRVLEGTEVATYTPLTGEAEWEGDWRFSELGADPSETGSQRGTDRVTIPFTGPDFALLVRRGDYRGYLFVSIDGAPAPLLPQNEHGAYLVLTSPDYTSQVAAIPVARGLADGPHEALVVAERGWTQWPLVGWRVSRPPDTRVYDWGIAVVATLGAAFLAGALYLASRRATDIRPPHSTLAHAGADGHNVAASEAAGWATWSAALLAAGTFYFSPWLPLTLLAWLAMAALILRKLEVGLALVALTAPFYMHPRPLLGKSFAIAEILLLTSFGMWLAREGLSLIPALLRPGLFRTRLGVCLGKMRHIRWSALDSGVLCFLLVALVSTLAADYRRVALRELRVVVVEPALFYLMLRAVPLKRRQMQRVIDGFVAGALIVALVGLAQYALGINLITAEQGFRRLRAVYGSPNNAGLYLGRALPVLVAVTALGATRWRRIVYGIAVLPVGIAILLSFSKGAILLGVPLSLLALGILAGGRWLRAAVGVALAAVLSAIPLFRTPRFAALLDTQSGTTFFRLQLWRASWQMFLDHVATGVGPDNFLYQYRGRYILPSAWQEPDLSHPHNILLDYGCRLGIPGLIAGTWLQVAFWRLALPLRRLNRPDDQALALGLMASMLGFLAHGLVDASYFVVDLAFVFFLTLGVVHWLAAQEKGERHGIKI